MKLLSILLVLTAWTTISASAKWGPLPLKNLVESSDCIVVAEFVSEDSRITKGERTDQLASLKVTTQIKGTTAEKITITGFEDRICTPQYIFSTTKGEKYLLFLHKHGDQYKVNNGIFGALPITDNQVNWFTDESQRQHLGQRKPTDLETAITAIQREMKVITKD